MAALIQNFNAVEALSNKVSDLNKACLVGSKRPQNLKALQDERYAYATALAFVLQERMCRANPNRAVPAVDVADAILFANHYPQLPAINNDADVVSMIGRIVGQRFEGIAQTPAKGE